MNGARVNPNDSPVLLNRSDAIAEIVLNRPAVLNAVNTEMAETLLAICKTIAADSEVRVVVLRGAGKAFMAGGDLAGFHADPQHAADIANGLITPLNEAIAILAELRQPVVASLHGAVAGAGVSLALASDLAIAADDVKFNLAYALIGASPDVSASWSLPRVVGLRKAMEIALLAENFGANEALRLNIVNRVVSSANLMTETEALVRRLAVGPTVAYGSIKRLLRTSHERNLREQMEAERDAFCACARTRDFIEGVDAFFAKRAANFSGS